MPAVMLAVVLSLAIAVPSAVAAKKPAVTTKPAATKQRTPPRMIRGVQVDSTGLPTWLASSIGPKSTDASIGEFTFPPTLSSMVKLDQPKGWIGFTMLRAPKQAKRETHRGGVVYRTRTFDVVQDVRDDLRMRETIVVRKRQGVRTWSWRLHRSGPGITPRVAPNGQVVLGDSGYIDRPSIHHFDGTRIKHLNWSLRGNVLQLRVDDRKLAVPYLIDPPAGLDVLPPTTTFNSFIENTPQYSHLNAAGTTLYYNPAQSGSFGMQFVANDSGTGVKHVTFPNLAAGWSAGGNDTTGWSPNGGGAGTGTGLNASYQNYTPCPGISPSSAAFQGIGFTRVDGPIDYNWGTGAPPGSTGIGANCYTVRWIGYLEIPTTGTYRFRTQSDDGVRLWVDGYSVINNWTDHSATWDSAGVPGNPTFTAGERVPIILDFNENGGDAVIRLHWDLPGGSNTAWVPVPVNRMYEAAQYDWTYTWSAGAAQPPTGLAVTAVDNQGNVSDPKQFAVVADAAGPTGLQFNHVNAGLQTGTTVTFNQINGGSDAMSGFNRSQIEQRTRPLVNDTCTTGSWSAWGDVGPLNPTATYTLTGLAGGLCYEFRLASYDNVDNVSYQYDTSTPGVRVDDASPTGIGPVLDGPTAGTDIDYFSAAPLEVTWSLAVDTWTGVNRQEWCIGTGTNATGCTGPVMNFTNVPGGVGTTSATRMGGTLVDGTTYYTCVRAQDNAGNPWSVACSDGQRYDSSPPVQPAVVRDGAGADIDQQSSTTTAQANWPAASDPHSGIAGYQTCVTTSASGADCAATALAPWNATAAATSGSRTGLALAMGTTYYFCVRAENNAGLLGAPPRCSDGFEIDSIGPAAPAFVNDRNLVTGDIDWTNDTTSRQANWATVTDPSGVANYEHCVTTSAAGADCVAGATRPWASTGMLTSESAGGLTLTNGTTYYSCARGVDGLGNIGATTCSNGVTVDTVRPTLPTAVNDGIAADLTWLQSLTTASANWTGGGDAGSGIAAWEYCISTGANCSGTIVKNWTAAGTATTQTSAGLALVQGQQYFTAVRGTDVAGNTTVGSVSSNGQRVDTIAPPVPAAINDGTGADADFSSSGTTFDANWTGVTDPAPGVGVASGLQRYQYCITTTVAGADCSGAATRAWTDVAPLTTTTLSATGLTLTNGTLYRVCVRAHDAAGNPGAIACSDGTTIDTGGPVWGAGAARDGAIAPTDIAWTTSNTTLASNWDAATDPGGIDRYAYCLSTSPTGADCSGAAIKPWTSNGLTRTQTSSGLTLAEGATYYSCIRAFDVAGNPSDTDLCSNGQRVDSVPPVLPAVVSDGTGIDLTWLQSLTTASANWPGGSDATSGIADWSYCIATGPDCSGTIVKNWTAAGTATTQTSAGLALVEGQQYFTAVRGSDVAGNTTLGTVSSNGQRVDTIAPPAPAAVNDGAGADITFQATDTSISANWAGVTDPAPGVGVASGLQRFEYCITTAPVGGDCAGAATVAWSSLAPLTSTSVTHTGLSLTNGATYYVCVRAHDAATNAGVARCSNGVVIDIGPPSASWTSWTVTNTDPARPHLYSPGGNVLWFNPNTPAGLGGTATATVTATDPGAGMNRVEFPNLGAAGWGAGGTDTSVGAGNTWTHGYTMTGGGTIGDPAPNNATAFDNGGAFTGSPNLDFDIRPDSGNPTGGSMPAMPGGLQRTNTFVQSGVAVGTDSGSGVARWVMDVQFAPLRDNVCGAWDPWIDGSTIPGYSGAASNGATLSFTHRLNDPDNNGVLDYFDAFCFRTQVHVFDQVGNMSTIPAAGLQRFDFGTPDVAVTAPANGTPQSGTVNITGTSDDVWAGGGFEYVDTGSGIDRVTVTWESPDGPDADLLPDATGNACPPITTLAGPWTGQTWTCAWDTTALPADGVYTLRVQARDRAGNLSTSATRTHLIDNYAPLVSFHSWDDHGSSSMHALGSVAWVNPNAATGTYQLDARVTASDAGSGVNRVEFPGLGAGWTPNAGMTNATSTAPVPVANAYTMAYTFTTPSSLAAPGSQQAQAFDGASNPASIPFEVRLDGAAPTGVSASTTGALQSSPLVAVTLDSGSDAVLGSGIAGWQLRVESAPLTGNACGSFTGVWSLVASGAGLAPATYAHDVTALGSGCYRYQLQVTDNVGNLGSSATTGAQRVDIDDPTVSIIAPLDGSVQGGVVTVSGDAIDTHSGAASVTLTWTGPASTSGTVCPAPTITGSAPTYGFSCSWATGTLPDGTYTITATATDAAGNASVVDQISVLLDNFPPAVGFHSFDTSTTAYAYWAGPIGNDEVWYNPDAPAGSHSFQAIMTASDPSGVSRVEFDGAGAGWTPGGSTSTQTAAIGPVDRYAQTYSFNTSGAVADPPTLTARAFDTANNPASVTFDLTPDADDPINGSVTATNGFAGSTSATVAINTGTDGTGSGIASWQLLRDSGTLSGAACVGWSGYTTSVATGTGQTSGSRADTLTDPGCFRYRLVVTDNVGRVATFDGTDVTKVDLTPPTGSLVLSENSGPQWQYLASPTRLFVNTSAAGSGSFDVDVSATAASGILDVDFPALAPGFTGAGVVPGPGPSFTRTYSWTGPAGAPAATSIAKVRSNSLGPLDLPFEIVADSAGPTADVPTHASGFTTSTSVAVSWSTTSATDGAGSGVASHQLQRQSGTLANGTCTWGGAWSDIGPLNGPATQTDTTLATATCYRYRTELVDNVGNIGWTTPSVALMVDVTPPTGASIVLTEGTSTARQHVTSPDTIWVAADPAGPASFTATVTAADPESGTGPATFPALGSTFTMTPVGTFQATYAWSATATAPGSSPVVQVTNGAGLPTSIPFNVLVDAAAPSGATIDQESGFVTDGDVTVAFTPDTDSGSGLATWRLERSSAPYSVATDTCAPWGAFTTYPAPTGQPTSPFVDTAVVQPTCYRYRHVSVDNVGNVATIDDGETAKVIVDIFPPAPFALNLPTNPALPAITTGIAAPSCAALPTFATATPSLSWTASSDAESGLSHYDVYVDGTGTIDASVTAPGTSWTTPALADGTHTLGVRALDNEANYRNAGPAFPASFAIDTTPPTGSLTAPADGSWTGDTTPTLDWSAADATCLARVAVTLDGAQVAVASGTESSWTPPTALADGTHTWSFEAFDALGNSTTFGPFTFGVDTTNPSAATITAPTAGLTVRGFVNVAWTAAVDNESGLSPAAAYIVIIDGTPRATLASGATSTTINSIVGGGHSIVIRAVDAVGLTTDSAPVLFTGYGAIPKPNLISPANNAKLNTVPTLQWSWPSDGGPAPTSYDVHVGATVDGTENHPSQSRTIADPGDGLHTWFIEQHDPYSGTVTSSSRTFLLDRTAPLNPGPLTRTATTMAWPAPVDPAAPVASGIASQQFWIDDGTTQTSTTLSASSTSRNFGLLPDGTYTMWVRALDAAGNPTDTPSVTVVNDSQPPTAFTLTAPGALPALPAITHGAATAPSCESAPTYTSGTPTLTWSASSDATSGLAGYEVFIDGASVASVGPGVTSYTPPAALAGGAHVWHVVASDNFGLTRASTPNPLTVRVDALPPSITASAPADSSYTADTTPTFSWAATDDNCIARVELTVGTNVYMLGGAASTFTPSVVLPEGPTTWSLRAFDSVGNVVSSSPARTINVDTTAPTNVTAISPTNAGTAPEQMMTFSWSAGTDAGSGVDHYDLIVDGTPVASGISTTTRGTFPIHAGAHAWAIRAYDTVGNSQLFTFTFTATPVPDVTAPDPFDLLTPADGAAVPAATPLTWDAAWDFKGVTQYRVYIDGSLAATTAGNVTTFTPAAGAGAPICTVNFDPSPSAGCLSAPTYAWGTGATQAGSGATSPHMNIASYPGWSAGGAAVGVGNPTVTPITSPAAGFDGAAAWTAVDYAVSIPAAGADIRFEHRYRTHVIGESAFDGASVELKVDDEGNGFADDVWGATCETDARVTYGATLDCMYSVVDKAGGYTAVLGGASKAVMPLAGQHAFAGTSSGTVQTRLSMADFAGMNVQVRFKLATDTCWVGMSADDREYCADLGIPDAQPALWRIDNVELADPALLPGLHTWRVEARDAAGNSRFSNQTWSFNLS